MSRRNDARLAELRTLCRPPRFSPGELVVDRQGNAGRIDAIFADLQAAIDARAVPAGWYGMQVARPSTLPFRQWFSVILEDGAILAGEDDLTRLTDPN